MALLIVQATVKDIDEHWRSRLRRYRDQPIVRTSATIDGKVD
jgi:hypothetical protein